MKRQNPDEFVRYAIRFYERAIRDINRTVLWLAETVSPEAAKEWNAGLEDTIAGLSELPRRCRVAREGFQGEVRQLLYQRQGSRMTHWIYFTIVGEEPDAQDAPTVMIMHIRNSSTRSLTRREIRDIEAGE